MPIARQPFRRSVKIAEDGTVTTDLPGRCALSLAKFYAPSAEECRQKLLALRERLQLSRANMAALLGVPFATLRFWETGQRNPSAPARKLIWVLDALFTDPQRLESTASIALWAK